MAILASITQFIKDLQRPFAPSVKENDLHVIERKPQLYDLSLNVKTCYWKL